MPVNYSLSRVFVKGLWWGTSNFINVVSQQRLRGISVRRQHNMRNILSGFFAVIVSSYAIVYLLGLTQPLYPEPFSMFWILLEGSSALQTTFSLIFNPSYTLGCIISWIIIGLIIGPFSKAGWNTVRSTMWVGLIIAIISLASMLLLHPAFWGLSSRNVELLYQFASSMLTALLSLPSAIPTALIVNKLSQQSELPVPTKIETKCECGAVFQSKPMMCSECGRSLSKN